MEKKKSCRRIYLLPEKNGLVKVTKSQAKKAGVAFFRFSSSVVNYEEAYFRRLIETTDEHPEEVPFWMIEPMSLMSYTISGYKFLGVADGIPISIGERLYFIIQLNEQCRCYLPITEHLCCTVGVEFPDCEIGED